MADYTGERPEKKTYNVNRIKLLRDRAIKKIKSIFLPDNRIIKIFLIGSSIKGDFGEYEPPGFRGSLYSDFDFIIFVEDEYKIPRWLKGKQSDAKPFPKSDLNLTHRIKNFVDNKYDAEILFVRRSTMENNEIERMAEEPGCEIPFSEKSRWRHFVVYSRL